ncbi:MAG: sulfatase-like hydrolase/transferase, partial [Candidatus Latescibacterota bacterium]|nr:sulfatase-like hydrolase/transferase [Candidatus Latescibacterota bacterium]
MTDQQRVDTIASLGNHSIYTPNLDRLVARGVSFVNAYSQTPVCVAARYAVRTGRDPLLTRVFSNGQVPPAVDQAEQMTDRCGSYLGQTMPVEPTDNRLETEGTENRPTANVASVASTENPAG